MLQGILTAKYPAMHANHFFYALDSIKQADFPTIRQYVNAIDFLSSRLAITKGWNQEMTRAKQEENFLSGLSSRTRLEMARLNTPHVDEIIHIISTVESTLFEQVEKEYSNQNYNTQNRTAFYKSNNQNRSHGYNRNRNEPNRRNNLWCWYHKSNKHSSKDCRHLNSQNNGYSRLNPKSAESNENTKKHSQYFLKENCANLQQLTLPTMIRNTEVKSIIDTGSERSIMTKQLVDKLELSTKETTPIQLGNKQSFRIKKRNFTLHSKLDFPRNIGSQR